MNDFDKMNAACGWIAGLGFFIFLAMVWLA